jgi:hypothetical protein
LLFGLGGRRWTDRIHVVWLKGLRPDTRSGKSYLGGVFFIVTALPALALIHFWRFMVLAPVMDRDANRQTDVFDWAPTTSCNPLLCRRNCGGERKALLTLQCCALWSFRGNEHVRILEKNGKGRIPLRGPSP